jgi:hypothetical protein
MPVLAPVITRTGSFVMAAQVTLLRAWPP